MTSAHGTVNEWATPSHAGAYLERGREWPPHRFEGEAVLLALLASPPLGRVLDLGTGDGRLLASVLAEHPSATGVAVDNSPTMLAAARRRFSPGGRSVEVVKHDLDQPLPVGEWGHFDAVISGLAIHHSPDARKAALYAEVSGMLAPGGWFCNLEHVASPTPAMHAAFFDAIGVDVADEDPSNKLVSVDTQLGWLRSARFCDVDCYWKWRELALLAGRMPPGPAELQPLFG